MSRFAVILPAAGMSSRFGDPWRKKVFIDLARRPVWLRSAEVFLRHPQVVQTILVISPDDQEWFRERFAANLALMDLHVVPGGQERADSVANGLAHLRDEVEYIAIHDAARPLVDTELVDRVFEAALQHGAAIPAIPISSTVKRCSDALVQQTVDRSGLWAAQTPQAFRRSILEQAYQSRGEFVATDDAQLVERTGHSVHVVEGSPLNLKITTRDDLRVAAALLPLVSEEQHLKGLDQPGPQGLW